MMPEKPTFTAGRERLLCLGALFCLLALSGIRDGVLLTRYDGPAGVDGYYYAVQVRSFVESRTFYYPTHTPFVLYMMSVAAKFGGDVVTAIQATGIFLHTALSLSLFALTTAVTKSMWKGLLAAAVTVSSVTHLIWLAEFLKQLGGLAFFFAGAACLAWKPDGKLTRPTAFLFVAVSVFCHKSIIFLIATLLCLALVFHLLLKIRGARLSWVKICAVILVGVCLPAAVAAQESLPVPRQIAETVLSAPQVPIKRTAFEEKLSLLFLAPLGLFLSLKESPVKRPGRGHRVMGVTALFTILFTLNPFLSHAEELMTISGRLDLLAYLQIAVLLPGVAWSLSSQTAALIISLSVISLLLLGNNTLPLGLQEGFKAGRKALANDLGRVHSQLPARPVIIAPHGIQFLVTYATGAFSQNSAPSDGGRESNVVWLVLGAPCKGAQNVTLVSTGRGCSVLIREGYPLPVTDAEKSQIIAMNPHLRNAPPEVMDRVLSVGN